MFDPTKTFVSGSNGQRWVVDYEDRRYMFTTNLACDDTELLAQGRVRENADQRRMINTLPYFVNRRDGIAAIKNGTLAPMKPEWEKWL